MIKNILCKIGFHKWNYYRTNFRKCVHCNIKQKQHEEISYDLLGTDFIWINYK